MHVARVSLFQKVKNKQFLRLLIKNMMIVLVSISLPLLLAVISIYTYSHLTLLKQTDAANTNTLENTRTTVDMLLRETESRLIHFSANSKVSDFLCASKEVHPNFRYIQRANEIMNDMYASRRPYLDSAITIYSEIGDFTLSTKYGGQSFKYYDDQDIYNIYHALKDQSPTKDMFYVLRNFSYRRTGSKPKWQISVYHTIPVTGSAKYSFACIDISVERLTSYLTDKTNRENGTILLVDENDEVILDSTGVLLGESIEAVFNDQNALKAFQTGDSGATTLTHGEVAQRFYWITSEYNGWRYVQRIPFQDYMESLNQLRNILFWIITIGFLVSIVIAYFISLRLFSPVISILRIVENPMTYDVESDRSGEIQYLLMNVLASFQKNITLEDEMIEKMSQLRNARAKALQEQMTPHFLYNALQTINWLAVSETNQENSKTSQSIITLAEIVYTCMEQSDNLCTVRDEIDYVRKYMEIAQLRFGGDIICHYYVDTAAQEFQILRISLQPLVENAITHGIQAKGCHGNIYLCVVCEESNLRVVVEDDGIGISDEKLAFLTERCHTDYIYANQHVGLINLSQRIKLVYGENYETQVNHSQYGGVKVEFTIPKVKSKRLLDEKLNTSEI